MRGRLPRQTRSKSLRQLLLRTFNRQVPGLSCSCQVVCGPVVARGLRAVGGRKHGSFGYAFRVLTAWADESGSRPDLDPGAYLLAAVLCEDDDVAEIRKTMEGLRSSEPKLHWHGSSQERRGELVETVARLPVTGFVVVHVDRDANDRRHRRKCMEFLLPHLADMPCSTITFESRGQLDASDLATLQMLRSRRVIEPTLRIEHAVGRMEPALWAADIVCGAVVQSRTGNRDYLDALSGAVELHTVRG